MFCLPAPGVTFRFSCRLALLTTATALVLAGSLRAAPENLGLGLKELVEAHDQALAQARTTALSDQEFEVMAAHFSSARIKKHSVLVDVYLKKAGAITKITRYITETLGGEVTGAVPWYRHGMLSAWVPLGQVSALATHARVSSVIQSSPPALHIGAATSQGVQALHADMVQANDNYKGAGITVGVLSDSYDKNTSASTHAAADVTSGDLPGTGNQTGYTTPVNVIEEDPNAGTDEGRAMCQIVHDMAPASAIAFATGEKSVADFANNIVALGTAVGSTYAGKAGAGCKVICDDLTYSNEPMFSDGVLAQAVDTVSGMGVSYFSSAGNDGNSGYIGTFTPQANNAANQALLLSQGGITYSAIPTTESSVISQFHSFGTSGGNPVLVQKVLIPTGGASTGTLNFQWDDPSDVLTNSQESVSTDYDLLVFSVSGTTATYESTLSLTENNFAYNEPIEYNGGNLTAGTLYEFVIVQTNRTPTNSAITANQATHLRWVLDTDAQQIIGDFVLPNSPNSYGHACAATCNGTAAYIYDQSNNTGGATYVPAVEAFSSNGNADIYFDSAGTRLATPETRKQPTLSAIDGVDTTFFGSDSDGDGKPNFFGTSAAAPHAAGCAALLLNAAAVLGKSLTPADVRTLLVNHTQGTADQDPGISKATLTLSGVPAATTSVAFTATDHSEVDDAYSLNVGFTGTSGQALTSLVITLPTPTVYFYTSFYPVTTGATTGTTPPSISSSSAGSAGSASATCAVNFSSFDPGDMLSFGVGRLVPQGTTGYGYATSKTDLFAGATISATVTGGTNPGTYTGTLANTTGPQWNYKSGYGLIDINAAVNALSSY